MTMSRIIRKIASACILLLTAGHGIHAGVPQIGAQVIIEPGQTEACIDSLFSTLKDNGMTVCRIRMFEDYMHTGDEWDFSLFDTAFGKAEKYGIRIFATLFPSSPGILGGFKLPEDDRHMARIAEYIKETVCHFRDCPVLDTWVLMNEPGTGGYIPDTEYTRRKFREWKEGAGHQVDISGQNPFLKENFLVFCITDYLGWLSEQVALWDTGHQIHTNNHQIFSNIAEYDFSAWRNFLTTFGVSAHPSWHFGYLDRTDYPVGMSASCSIVRSGAGSIPFWVTEIQGGNNTYSGTCPFCPTPAEISEWLWTSVAGGAEGMIFWTLNARKDGSEAGEWALLDYLGRPSERVASIREISEVLNSYPGLFSDVRPIRPSVYIAYNRISLWTEKKYQYNSDPLYEGREPGGIMKSVLSYYRTFCNMGLNPEIVEMDDFDWNREDFTGMLMVLPNMIAIPSRQSERLKEFVRKGGKLFVEGLSGFYDGNMTCMFNDGFTLKDVFGGTVTEFECIPGDFELNIGEPVHAHLWKGYIEPCNGTPTAEENGRVTAIRNSYGQGSVIWIPSLIGLGCWRQDLPVPAGLIFGSQTDLPEIRLAEPYPDITMYNAEGAEGQFSVIINKGQTKRRISVESPYRAEIIYGKDGAAVTRQGIVIGAGVTAVLKWE